MNGKNAGLFFPFIKLAVFDTNFATYSGSNVIKDSAREKSGVLP